jgi:hypothetical protein
LPTSTVGQPVHDAAKSFRNQETAMPATQQPKDPGPQSDDDRAGQPTPTPDEDGPHDVPDDKVIEKTLPAGKGPEQGSRGS